jgi:cytochrome c oxidase cbb3-type subunit III
VDHNKDFDGVTQADNALPPWWKNFFVICIVIGVGYAIYFHGFSDWKMEKLFESEVAAHEKKFPPKEELKALAGGENPLRGNAEAIEKGQKNFKAICAACHGQNAEGTVGPSLVDKDWLHGDYDEAIFSVIMKGVNPPNTKLERGPMPAHEASLGAEKVYQIMAWLAKNNETLKKVK